MCSLWWIRKHRWHVYRTFFLSDSKHRKKNSGTYKEIQGLAQHCYYALKCSILSLYLFSIVSNGSSLSFLLLLYPIIRYITWRHSDSLLHALASFFLVFSFELATLYVQWDYLYTRGLERHPKFKPKAVCSMNGTGCQGEKKKSCFFSRSFSFFLSPHVIHWPVDVVTLYFINAFALRLQNTRLESLLFWLLFPSFENNHEKLWVHSTASNVLNH